VAKGRWKRRAGWAFVVVLTIGILLAATWRSWTPTALRFALKTRGISVTRIKWEGTDSWTFEGVQRSTDELTVRAKTVTMLTPSAWKQALRNGDTNKTYITVNGWRVILPAGKTNSATAATNSIAGKIQRFNDGVRRVQQRCPRALFLNGTIQTAQGEFNFGAVEWKGGELGGDFTWPLLNDPAEFHLKIVDAAKLQLIVKQIALEIGGRATAEVNAETARLKGYARWKTNRIDFDATFSREEDTPTQAVIDSKGLAWPGRFIGMPEVEALNARMRLVITNGQFDLAIGAPAAAESGEAAQ
jgi:hypothetical protein